MILKKKIFHVHAKDTRIDWNRLDEVGIFGFGWYIDKVAGREISVELFH